MTDKKKFELEEEDLVGVAGGNQQPEEDNQENDAEDDRDGGNEDVGSGNSVPKYNNINNGGKQMFVQQGKNTNKNTGVNKM